MADVNDNLSQFGLTQDAARTYTSTTKSAPQMTNITSRWLLKILPWVSVQGGTYQVNRVVTGEIRNGHIAFQPGGDPTKPLVDPKSLNSLPMLHKFHDDAALAALAAAFTIYLAPGNPIDKNITIVNQNDPIGSKDKDKKGALFVIGYGKAEKTVKGVYEGDFVTVDVLGTGDCFGEQELLLLDGVWPYTITTISKCTILVLTKTAFDTVCNNYPLLKAHIEKFKSLSEPVEPPYEITSREYQLYAEQTVFSIPTRVADLYNNPINQTEKQLKLTVEQLRERQEHRLINDENFGLLHNVAPGQHFYTRDKDNEPTPHDLDKLLTTRRDPQFLLAHPKAIDAIARKCNELGLYPQSVNFAGLQVPAWRGVPILPCTKIPINPIDRTTSIIVMRTGEQNEGVIGLTQTGIPDEYEPGLNVRFMGVNAGNDVTTDSMISYLVSAYFSVAVLAPDALGVLSDVVVGY